MATKEGDAGAGVGTLLTKEEHAVLRSLLDHGVRFLLVGQSAAVLQGSRGATEDIDIWLEQTSDPRVGDAVRAAGAVWVSGSFGLQPPQILCSGSWSRLDVVMSCQGLRSFEEEYAESQMITIDGLALRILPLERILVSKKAVGRPKDLAQIPALETALSVLAEKRKK